MIEWATNQKVNSIFYKDAMTKLRQRYLNIVGDDNLSTWKEFELPRILEAILNQQGKKILDFGTGMSCLPAYLSELGYEVWCLDVPEENGGWHPEIDEKSYNEVFKSNVHYIKDSIIEHPECIPNDFDVIYSASSLEHVRYLGASIAILKTKLKEGGIQIHLVDYDPISHPVDFKQITPEELPEQPEDLYEPEIGISRLAII